MRLYLLQLYDYPMGSYNNVQSVLGVCVIFISNILGYPFYHKFINSVILYHYTSIPLFTINSEKISYGRGYGWSREI